MATHELHRPQVFTKTQREDFNQDTAKCPYLTFKLGYGVLQRLVVRIWSNDQGWCDDHLKTEDPYANSYTWFSFGLVEETTSGQKSPGALYEFQRNVRASSNVRCHTNQWNLDMPTAHNCDEVHAWIESLTQVEGSVIGVFPLAKYPGWVNTVWKMEVLVHSNVEHNSLSSEPRTWLSYSNDAESIRVSQQSSKAWVVSLEEELHTTNSAIQLPSKNHSTQAANLDDLAKWLYDRYTHTKALKDLDKAIHFVRQVLDATPEDNPDWTWRLNKLGLGLSDRYSHTGDMTDLQEAIYVTKKALQATSETHPIRAVLLNNLGNRLGDRYLHTGAIADLNEAIAMARHAINIAPKNHPDRIIWLNNLGIQLSDRYSQNGAVADLEEAISISRKAMKAISEDHPNRAAVLISLGNRLGDRYSLTGILPDLEEAISIIKQAIESTQGNHPHRALGLNSLSLRLGDRYSCTGSMADLEEAICIARQAVENTPEDHLNQAALLNNLGIRLGDKFSRTGEMADIEEAILVARKAIKSTPEGHTELNSRLNNLGVRLSQKYSHTGAFKDLEEAILVTRQAVEAVPQDHPNAVPISANLGNRLGERYLHTGAIGDLDEAILVTRQAIQATPKDHPEWPGRLGNLGIRLSDRYLRTSIGVDLEEAIQVTRKALSNTPKTHPEWAIWLNDLGNRFSDRYRRTSMIEDLEEAIRIARLAIETTPEDHPNRVIPLSNLGKRLGDRYLCTGTKLDLEEAILIARQVVDVTPDHHPSRAERLNDLANILRIRYSHTGAIADLEESQKAYTTSLNTKGAFISARIFAGRKLLSHSCILQNRLEAYHIAQTAINLVPKSAPFALYSADKQNLLSQAVGIASDAAAVVLHVGQGPIPAIELLEIGRGVIASSLQDIRTDLSSLEKRHPKLARLFVKLRNLLDTSLSISSVDLSPRVGPLSAVSDQRYQASSQMTALISEIRCQPNFERFLMAATGAQIQEAAAHGPIVIINVSSHRCDALIIEQAGIRAVELEQLTQDVILSKAGQIKSLETLSWLWTAVAKPVLDALGFTKTLADNDFWPHVWWVPTGPLVRFPLHAAGHHLQGNSETVLDRVISSYASSIKSIINTRQRKFLNITADQGRKVVLVAMQETPEQSVLQHTTNEVNAVQDICTSRGMPYSQPQPYQKAVLDDLDTCHIFHFAGHGGTNPKDPLQSHLLLKDWQDNPLSVGSLLNEINLQSTSPFLAYLSACGTGQILDDKSIDENIHLTSAFQLAGFRHVIGTLWEVDDALCVDMARMTYEFMSEKGFSDESVSCGLHHAARRLRDRWIGRKNGTGTKRDAVLITNTAQSSPTWVPYFHYGV